ncbi:hypothetical protein M707_02630 [Arthrobacter sp. AK-YN10]|nr:hypothetical protein M707_02630 [Arthrobacter sp. AK-YN10]
MSARVEAAARMINARSVRPADWDDPSLTAYRLNRMHDARKVLAAADEVMFSEAAIERAALRLWNAKHPSDPPLSDLSELMEWTRESYLWQARAVVEALREEA